MIDLKDCMTIRQIIDEYNSNQYKATIITEIEAQSSPFFDDCGDIKLGFIINSIDYL